MSKQKEKTIITIETFQRMVIRKHSGRTWQREWGKDVQAYSEEGLETPTPDRSLQDHESSGSPSVDSAATGIDKIPKDD